MYPRARLCPGECPHDTGISALSRDRGAAPIHPISKRGRDTTNGDTLPELHP
jgi:hypothetical protein